MSDMIKRLKEADWPIRMYGPHAGAAAVRDRVAALDEIARCWPGECHEGRFWLLGEVVIDGDAAVSGGGLCVRPRGAHGPFSPRELTGQIPVDFAPGELDELLRDHPARARSRAESEALMIDTAFRQAGYLR